MLKIIQLSGAITLNKMVLHFGASYTFFVRIGHYERVNHLATESCTVIRCMRENTGARVVQFRKGSLASAVCDARFVAMAFRRLKTLSRVVCYGG